VGKMLSFSPEEYRRRLEETRQQMAERDLDALVVSDPRNIRYLSGFHTYGYWDPIALIVLPEGEPIHFTLDFERRNVEVRAWTSRWEGYTQWDDPTENLRNLLRRLGCAASRVGVEKQAWFFTIAFYEALTAGLPDARFIDSSGLVDRIRFIKSPQELIYIRRAAQATVRATQAAIEACGEGRSENDVAAAVYRALIEAGSEPPAIPPLINAGFRSSLPHVVWGGKRLDRGDLVFIELSGSCEGYHAPLCRVVAIGDCGDEQKRIAATCLEAVEVALGQVRPNVPMGEVDRAARDVFRRAGLDEHFRTPIGYPVGLGFPIFWGEQPANPMMLEGEQARLEPGMVFHMIPSIQHYGLAEQGGGHITISSTIAVSDDGYEVLTDFPRQLFFR
jgi:ectoine hydrolase